MCRDMISDFYQIHTKHISTQYGENVEYLNITPCGRKSRQLDLKAEVAKQSIPAAFWYHSKFIYLLSMEKMGRGVYRLLVGGNRRERDHWGDQGVDGWIILGWICGERGCV